LEFWKPVVVRLLVFLFFGVVLRGDLLAALSLGLDGLDNAGFKFVVIPHLMRNLPNARAESQKVRC
jgi:hypothetical protein